MNATNLEEVLADKSRSVIMGFDALLESIGADPALCANVSSDDESGNVVDRDYTGFFEGPEKTLEVVFSSGGRRSL